MQYKYTKEHVDYSDLSSGRVFYSVPGHPAFPVRLASEIFQRCLAHRESIYGTSAPCTLYDPCCGAAYHLSILAYLHGNSIREMIASDIDEKAVELARRNLGLLRVDGLEKRIDEILEMLEKYGKESHQEALQSASILKKKISRLRENYPLEIKAFQCNATNSKEIKDHINPKSVDIVFTDVPYGRHSAWHISDSSPVTDPLHAMLDALGGVLSVSSIVAIASDKQQKVIHEKFQRLEHFPIGKRRVVILKPVSPYLDGGTI